MHRRLKQDQNIVVGQRARLVAGPLDGTEVRVVNIAGSSVRASLDLLGRDVETKLRADVLEGLGSAGVNL